MIHNMTLLYKAMLTTAHASFQHLGSISSKYRLDSKVCIKFAVVDPLYKMVDNTEFQACILFGAVDLKMFCSSHFWFLVTFGNKVTKIWKYYVIFVYILQGKMGKTEKNQKENNATKMTKIPKTKRRKYGMNRTK